jgi:hypothetical protein
VPRGAVLSRGGGRPSPSGRRSGLTKLVSLIRGSPVRGKRPRRRRDVPGLPDGAGSSSKVRRCNVSGPVFEGLRRSRDAVGVERVPAPLTLSAAVSVASLGAGTGADDRRSGSCPVVGLGSGRCLLGDWPGEPCGIQAWPLPLGYSVVLRPGSAHPPQASGLRTVSGGCNVRPCVCANDGAPTVWSTVG